MSDFQIDVRGLLDHLGIEWQDRGQGIRRGYVNINCPFCLDDPSYHLGIHLTPPHWYSCWRDPTHHGPSWRLVCNLIGGNRAQAEQLMLAFSSEAVEAPPPQPKKASGLRWEHFDPATESPAMRDYLLSRGFPNPLRTMKLFDLRYAPYGGWAQRLLLPLYNVERQPVSWTGRSIRGLEPRYKNAGSETRSLVGGDLTGKSYLLVEGPMDALKINDSLPTNEITAVSINGLNLSSEQLLLLRTRKPERIFLAIDDEALNSHRNLLDVLTFTCKPSLIRWARVPTGYKDPGEMRPPDVIAWIGELLKC